MSNHFHLILRSRPDVVLTWVDTDVARRWLLICPVRKNSAGEPEEPNEFGGSMIMWRGSPMQNMNKPLSTNNA